MPLGVCTMIGWRWWRRIWVVAKASTVAGSPCLPAGAVCVSVAAVVVPVEEACADSAAGCFAPASSTTSTNRLLSAAHTGHSSGGSSPSWMYPHTVHSHFFIVTSLNS